MMVLVATAIGVGWTYSVAATSLVTGDVFHKAVAMLATLVLLGHWFESVEALVAGGPADTSVLEVALSASSLVTNAVLRGRDAAPRGPTRLGRDEGPGSTRLSGC